MVPELVWLTAASTNYEDFLGPLNPQNWSIYVFVKGYVIYTVYKKLMEEGSFYVTHLNENANCEVISELHQGAHNFLYEGTILDQIVLLRLMESERKLG